MGPTYQLHIPHVAAEPLAGDLLLLHFGSGLYYNLHGTAADVCTHLLAGGTPSAAADQLAAHFGLESQRIAQDIQAFVDQLLREGLIVPADRSPNDQPLRITAQTYAPPQFQKYDDMADQLLLDKIDDQSPDAPASAALEI